MLVLNSLRGEEDDLELLIPLQVFPNTELTSGHARPGSSPLVSFLVGCIGFPNQLVQSSTTKCNCTCIHLFIVCEHVSVHVCVSRHALACVQRPEDNLQDSGFFPQCRSQASNSDHQD